MHFHYWIAGIQRKLEERREEKIAECGCGPIIEQLRIALNYLNLFTTSNMVAECFSLYK